MCKMNDDNSKPNRRSTRLTISIPIIISGVDADGNSFYETVRTQVVNKHGGRIATAHRLTMGTQVLIENRTMGVVAKATVVWLGEMGDAGGLRAVGLQLLEAQNVWGITFPPEDWCSESEEKTPPTPNPSKT